MTYLEAQELISQIETKYDVSSIRYKGVPVWPFLRLYLLDNLSTKRARGGSASNVWLIIKRLFSYNPLCIFKKYKVWIYTGVATRKQIGEKNYCCISGAIPDICKDTLVIENPEASKTYKLHSVNEKYIISNALSILIIRGLEYLMRPFKLDIKNEVLLISLLKDCNSDFNYKKYIRFLYNQKIATDFLLYVSGKPNVVFILDAYDQMGYVWSLHNHGIPVIELQHGVINKNHNGYNCPIDTGLFAPDKLCVFGDNEYNLLIHKVALCAHSISKTGMFFLEKIDYISNTDIFFDYRKQFDKIIVVSGQTGYENVLAQFIEELSGNHPKLLFVYIPRRHTELSFSSKNVILRNGINIYPYLKWCDIHVTIYSTTCLEAHFFRKKNIFYNYDNLSITYYGDLLTKENAAYYVTNSEQFEKALNRPDKDFHIKEFYTRNHYKKIKEIVNYYIND